MRWLTLWIMGALAVASAGAQDVAEAEKLARRGEGPAAQAVLAKLALSQRQSLDYHRALALASQAQSEATTAADAVLVIDTLRKDGLDIDVSDVRAWLDKQAQAQYAEAMRALDANDRSAAARAYIRAVRTHQSILGKDDKGLRDAALKGLKAKAAKQPVQVSACFALGVYAFACGALDDAAKAFRDCAKLEKDGYRRWRAGLLAGAIDVERAHTRALDAEASRPRAGGGGGSGGPEPGGGGHVGVNPATQARREALQQEIAQCQREIDELSSPDGWKRFEATDGRRRKGSVNSPYVQEKLEAVRKQKTGLEIELNNLH